MTGDRTDPPDGTAPLTGRTDSPRLTDTGLTDTGLTDTGLTDTGRPHTGLTHIDDTGRARMVDVGAKPLTERVATAAGRIVMAPATLKLIMAGGVRKGDVLTVARLAGIMGARRTADLIPLCHPLGLDWVDVGIAADADRAALTITATAKLTGRTGVEMEALTAVTIAGLTVYDMCKAVDREMRLTDIRLTGKSGGRSGVFRAP